MGSKCGRSRCARAVARAGGASQGAAYDGGRRVAHVEDEPKHREHPAGRGRSKSTKSAKVHSTATTMERWIRVIPRRSFTRLLRVPKPEVHPEVTGWSGVLRGPCHTPMTKPSLMKSATHERGSGAWYVPSGEKSYLPVSRKAWQVHAVLDRSPAMRRRRSHLVVAIVATSATVATGASVGASGRGRDSPEVRVRLAVLPRVAEAAANGGLGLTGSRCTHARTHAAHARSGAQCGAERPIRPHGSDVPAIVTLRRDR